MKKKSKPTPGGDLESMTRAQLVAEYKATQGDIKALQEAGGDDLADLTPEQLGDLETLVEYRDSIKALVQAAPAPKALKASIAEGDEFLRPKRPHPGTAGIRGDNPKGDTKAEGGGEGRIDAAESEDDKYLEAGGEFKGLGHFVKALHATSGKPGNVRGEDTVLGRWNDRLDRVERSIKSDPAVKAISGLGEFSDPDGAAFIPPTYSTQIWERVTEQMALLNFFDTQVVSGNTYVMTAWDDKARTNGSLYGGATGYWIAEGADYIASAPKTRTISHRLKKLGVLMYLTEELMEDSVALDSRLSRVAGACFTDRLNEAFLRGDGSAQPVGLLKAGCKVTASAVSGQGDNTLTARNVLSMWSRRSPGADRSAIWLYNIGVEPSLESMYLPTGSNSGQLVYMMPAGLSGGKYQTLKGRPAIECEYCETLGTEGDLILVDPRAYLVTLKSSGIKSAISMHVRFLQDEQTLKWTFRVDGRPYWDTAMTPANGDTRSPIVTLSSTRT